MGEAAAKKQKKVHFGEEDVCNLFQRYSASQVLAFLHEVAHSPGVKIDWNALVKNTTTGITNARECQILWRHLAYRQPLSEKTEEEGDQPLDDDSDLECELEPSPLISNELAMEAANCVKILGFGSPNESSVPNSSAVVADMPNGHLSKGSSENPHPTSLLHSSNITLPLSVQKQPQAAVPSGEELDANGLPNSNFPPRRKRKPWSEEEDLELIAAVKKFGEGNWANIVKGEFKGDRTASQLSQRWAIIRKKQGGLNIGGASSQLSEAQLATRRAIDMALKDNLTGGCNTVGNGTIPTNNQANVNASNGEAPPTPSITNSSQPLNTQPTNTTTSMKPTPPGVVMAKPRPPPKKVLTKPSVSDSIQAAAVAAGARIASPSDAATLFKAAQSKNAVHIIGGTSLMKPSTPGSSPLPPNVHFIRTGLVANTASTCTVTAPIPPPTQMKGITVKPTVPTSSVSQPPKTNNEPTTVLDKSNALTSTSANETKQTEDETLSEVKILPSDVRSMPEVQEDDSSLPKCSPKVTSTSPDSDPGKQTVNACDSKSTVNKEKAEIECKDEKPAENEKQSGIQGSCNISTDGNLAVSSSTAVDEGGVEKMETSSEAEKCDVVDQ